MRADRPVRLPAGRWRALPFRALASGRGARLPERRPELLSAVRRPRGAERGGPQAPRSLANLLRTARTVCVPALVDLTAAGGWRV